MKYLFLVALLFLLASCYDNRKIIPYEDEIKNYSCTQLRSEQKFQQELITQLTDSERNSSTIDDMAVGVMTLGMANIGSNRSMSSDSIYRRQLNETNERLKILETELKKCK